MPDIQNPQHEPGSEKRLLLVFVLTFVVMLLFQPLLKKYMPQPVTPAQQNQATQTQPAAPTSSNGDGRFGASNSRGRCHKARRQRN